MARTVRYFTPVYCKDDRKMRPDAGSFILCAYMLGSRRCHRFLGKLIFGLVGGGGIRLRTRTWNLVALAMLSGCAQLPLDGPAKQDIVTGASATLANPPDAVVLDYALVDINPIVLDCLADAETVSFSRTFGGRASALQSVQVMFWECPSSNHRVEASLPLEEPLQERAVGKVTSLRSQT